MHQNEYITFLLQEYGLLNCNSVLLPADPKAPLGNPAANYSIVTNLRPSYLKLIGELIYTSMNMRPDIAYIINSLAQHNANPEARHFAMVKCILCYLAGTRNIQLHYRGETGEDELHAYADASWASKVG